MAPIEVAKKWDVEDLRSGKVKLPEYLRTKSDDEQRKEDEEIERMIIAEDQAKAKSAEGRFQQMFEAPEADEVKYWRLASFINFLLIGWTGTGGAYIFYLHLQNIKYIQLLEAYDGGNLVMAVMLICLICLIVSIYGLIVTLHAGFMSKRGRLKYVLYAYIGWDGAIIILLVASLIFVGAVYLLLPHILKTGFLVQMLKFKDDVDIQKGVHFLQMDNRCCGNDNYTEWFSIKFSKQITKTLLAFPKSCCNYDKAPKDQCVHNLSKLTPWTQGCLPILNEMVRESILSCLAVLGLSFLAKLAVMLLCMSNMQAVRNYEDLVMREREKMISRKERTERVAKRAKIEKHGLSLPPPPLQEQKGMFDSVMDNAKSSVKGVFSSAPAPTAGPQ
ncbi:hypothetical protein HELRODRAFT_169960 [Helobdella robusta]|uniref:Tetraspanin n=1 Tax=Helobdella robusta TaxID=6412 RepID=T1F2H3_HELRO|nr:hypothetical protein HELRODRAFT_169960 [Helobdella robusta]ESO08221.1 hypothetical protein HELRODRAFT_169960 [Helobdella robusta]